MSPAIPVYDLCGVQIAAVTTAGATDVIVGAAQDGRAFEVHLCNAFTLSLVQGDSQLRSALLSSHLNLPDGAPVAWFGRAHGTVGPVRGANLVRDVARAGATSGLRHYLYGGAEGVAADLAARLDRDAPGVQIVGLETPPYRDLDDSELAALAERVNAAHSQVVWIGLGTPRQDYLVPRLAGLVNAAIVPVGAAFDFLAGRVKEPPEILHGTGLEWLYRFVSDPRRLWHRYLVGNPRFFLNVARSRRTS